MSVTKLFLQSQINNRRETDTRNYRLNVVGQLLLTRVHYTSHKDFEEECVRALVDIFNSRYASDADFMDTLVDTVESVIESYGVLKAYAPCLIQKVYFAMESFPEDRINDIYKYFKVLVTSDKSFMRILRVLRRDRPQQ